MHVEYSLCMLQGLDVSGDVKRSERCVYISPETIAHGDCNRSDLAQRQHGPVTFGNVDSADPIKDLG